MPSDLSRFTGPGRETCCRRMPGRCCLPDQLSAQEAATTDDQNRSRGNTVDRPGRRGHSTTKVEPEPKLVSIQRSVTDARTRGEALPMQVNEAGLRRPAAATGAIRGPDPRVRLLIGGNGTDSVLAAIDQLYDESRDERYDDVIVATAPQAKCGAWPSVKIADGFIPSRGADQSDDTGRPVPGPVDDAEARLAYVAVSRARLGGDGTGGVRGSSSTERAGGPAAWCGRALGCAVPCQRRCPGRPQDLVSRVRPRSLRRVAMSRLSQM